MQTYVSRSLISIPSVLMLLIFLFPFSALRSQPFQYDRKIKWDAPKTVTELQGTKTTILSFQGSANLRGEFEELPAYIEAFPLFTASDSVVSLKIVSPVWETVGQTAFRGSDKIRDTIIPAYSRNFHHKKPFLNLSFIPLVKDASGNVKRLVSFKIHMEILPGASAITLKSAPAFAGNSVLATGKWTKMFLNTTGVYKLTYAELVAMDAGFATADPRTIRIYGNGGGMLPEPVASPRIDDLREVSIVVAGEEDGKLDGGDYILFYATGPDTWSFNATNRIFQHRKNIYSDQSCYFITYGQAGGKRVTPGYSTTLSPTLYVQTYNDYAFYEKDDINLIKSGREWFDKENFEFTTTRNYSFTFPDIDPSSKAILKTEVAGRSTAGNTSFTVFVNNEQLGTIPVPGTGGDTYDIYAKLANLLKDFDVAGPGIDIRLTYNKMGKEAVAWLNFLEINVKRQLRLNSGQIMFRSADSYGAGKVTRFTLSSAGQAVTIWDVTRQDQILAIQAEKNGNNYLFTLPTDTLKEFAAWDGTSFLTIQSFQAIENQNLHATEPCDYLIIAHPTFMNEANELAEFHRNLDNMTVFITTPDKVYNEFSGGVQDVTAIREFTRLLFSRSASGRELKYLLLFGDASYDYKKRLVRDENLVPGYQSWESLNPLSTYATDDFFGMMESNDSLDIGVGRFPVTTVEQARNIIRKIRHYSSNTDSVKNDWRNLLCFVADDEDGQQYMSDAENVAGMVQTQHPVYNIDKIYIDAYPQISTPGGNRSPEVNDALNQRITKGTLIVDYIGHGGEKGWAHERILEIPDIKAWSNTDNLAVFVTATCEFTRYEDPDWISAGEWVFLNPGGGGIALFTTTRPTYADANLTLTRNFYYHAFSKTDGVYPKMGDIIVKAKNKSGTGVSTRKFILIGDPALQINYPNYNVVTTSISHAGLKAEDTDTLRALSTMTIAGEVRDDSGQKIENFNGTVYPTVYDKVSEITTLANDPGSSPFNFDLSKNIIYKGKIDVSGGNFTFSFIVPKDIAYQYGPGRISYYARSSETDAGGFDSDIIVGGYDENASVDNNGPEIRLFMNDTNFVSGGMTDQNPNLLALLRDESGINTVGNGIGHDITITLDDNNQNQKIANDYYTSDQNTFTSGSILYPFFNLSDGWHTARLKVWDVYNNSSDAKISFVVASSAQLALDHLFNYPNPFQDYTTFSFEYNHPSTDLDVTIAIYNMRGQLLKTLSEQLFTEGYRANTIRWDGTSDSGSKISTGNYIYEVTVSTPGGETVRKSSRLVVIR